MTRKILQFGTSRFLQAHVDLFVHEARAEGADAGPITVVKTTSDRSRDARVSALADGYPVIIRGLDHGRTIDHRLTVTSVKAALSIHRDRPAVQAAMLDADIVISNTGEAGFDIPDQDRIAGLMDSPDLATSFPGKLLQLLGHRWRNGARGIAIFPCELINRNGRVLKRLLLELADVTSAPAGFIGWLSLQPFADSLVDRIVATPLEPAGAIAEPYALWAIERQEGLPCPVEHAQVVMTDDLEPFERLKLHILNLGHTVLADFWHQTGRPADETVKLILTDATARSLLDKVYRSEVLPGFAARGLEHEATAYIVATLERFANPFLEHRIADIHGNHALKVDRRIVAFKHWALAAGWTGATPTLDAVILRASC